MIWGLSVGKYAAGEVYVDEDDVKSVVFDVEVVMDDWCGDLECKVEFCGECFVVNLELEFVEFFLICLFMFRMELY